MPKWSIPVKTKASEANTATINLDAVEAGLTYSYQIEVDGNLIANKNSFTTPTFYHDRMPAPDLRIAIGGAHYQTENGLSPYQILGNNYRIFTSADENQTRTYDMDW